MSKNAVIIIQVDQIDWIKRHPDRFVNGLVTRLEQEEADKYPGYSRWDGDGCPGVQVVCVADQDATTVVSAGKGFGQRLGTLRVKHTKDKQTKHKITKELANRHKPKENNGNKQGTGKARRT